MILFPSLISEALKAADYCRTPKRKRQMQSGIVWVLMRARCARAEAVRLETMPGRDIRVACGAARRRRFLRCDRVQPRSDVDRLAEEIWRALLLLLRMWSRGRGSTPRRMNQ